MTRRPRMSSWAAMPIVGLLGLGACADALPTGSTSATSPRPVSAPVTLLVSDTSAARGARITVDVRIVVEGGALLAVEGGLAYDPATLRFIGQAGPDDFPTVVNPDRASTGEIRFIAFAKGGLPAEFVSLSFEVRRSDYARGLEYRHRNAIRHGTTRVAVDLSGRAALTETGVRLVTSAARIVTLADWQTRLGASPVALADLPTVTAAPRYGDVTRDQRIDLYDYLAVAFAAVGSTPLIASTAGEPAIDLVIAGNVAPALAGHACGEEASGHRELSLFDYLAIALEAIGEDEPCVGDVIPGRTPELRPRVTLRGSDLLIKRGVTRHFSADTLWGFKGVLRIEDGGRAVIAAGAVLEFAEGPHHGFRASSGLLVQRGGTLIAQGTVAAPIVLRCWAAVPRPGCWGGVDIEGSGNDAYPNTLEFVRIEYAGGAAEKAPNDAPALRLIDVDHRALVRAVQVHGARGTGLEVRGGNVGLREILLTGNAGAALRFSGDQRGQHERIIVQAPAHSGSVRGGVELDIDPTTDSSADALELRRLTLVGNLAPRHTPAIWMGGRAATRITGLVVAGYGTLIQRSTSAPCGALSAWTEIQEGAVTQTDSSAVAASCVRMDAVITEDAARWLRSACDTERPDWRPTVGAPPSVGHGAADATRDGVIPWFAGWSRGFRAGTEP